MKNQLYWLTNSNLNEIDFYDESHKPVPAKPTVINKLKNLFSKSNENINFTERAAEVSLKPIERTKYNIIEQGIFPPLIPMFKYFLFEEKIALAIQAAADHIRFEAVDIYNGNTLIEDRKYFLLINDLRKIHYSDCAKITVETDELFLVGGMDLYFSESLKLKLEPFFKEHYNQLNFAPATPYLVC